MTVVGRWWSLGVVGERRGSWRVFDMSKICNVLCGTPDERSVCVQDRRTMDGGDPKSTLPTLPKCPHTVHVPFLLSSASAHWSSLTIRQVFAALLPT